MGFYTRAGEEREGKGVGGPGVHARGGSNGKTYIMAIVISPPLNDVGHSQSQTPIALDHVSLECQLHVPARLE